MSSPIQPVHPEGLAHNPAFSHVIVTSRKSKTVFIGGQNALDANGQIVGKGDIRAQTEQVLKNLQTALASVGASYKDVVKCGVYLVQGQSLQQGFEVYQAMWGQQIHMPTVSVLVVAGLAHPDFLLEIDAIAVVPE